jgi:uncharacterized repeat protein (TIGR02543 family)
VGNGKRQRLCALRPHPIPPGFDGKVFGNLGYLFKPSYSFTGWNTAADGTGTAYVIGATTNSNLTFYAQWSALNWPPVSIWGGAREAILLKTDGTVWTRGYNANGRLGDGSTNYNGKLGGGTTQDHYSPEQVPGLSGTIVVLAGDSFTSVLLGDGTVWTFGSNGAGQLGVPNIDQSLVPVQVEGLCHAIYIMARNFHNEAICGDGSVWSWGSGTSGELGNGPENNSAVPVQVSP